MTTLVDQPLLGADAEELVNVPTAWHSKHFWNVPINRWWTVLAGMLGSVVGAGSIMVYSYGLIAAAMAVEFGWGRNQMANDMSAFLIGSGLGTVLLGWLISRLGVRLPSGIMATSFGFLFAAVAILPPSPSLHLLMFLWIGIMGGAATALPYAVSISGNFESHRGLAIGLVVAGGGLGAAIGPALAETIITSWGWRAALASIGLTAAAIPFVGFLVLVRSPPGITVKRDHSERSGYSTYFTVSLFWKLAIPVLIVSIATFGAMTNLVALLKDGHFAGHTIASILSFAGLVSWGSRIGVGYLLDRFHAPFVSAFIFVGTAVGLVLVTTHGSVVLLYVGAALLALALSSEADLITYMASRYFRLADYSRIIGLLWVIWAWGGSGGALVADRSFAWFGTYRTSFYGFALLLLLAVAIILTMGPYRETSGKGI